MFRVRGEPLCRKVQGMLSEYLDNKLDSGRKGIVERHLESCEACAKELDSLRMTVRLLGRVSQAPVPRSFTLPVPEPRRENVFVPSGLRLPRPATAVAAIAVGPASLRWLRPATVVATIALMAMLMLDFLPVFDNGTGGRELLTMSNQTATFDVSGEGNETDMAGILPGAVTPAPTQEGVDKDGGKVGEPPAEPAPPGGEELAPFKAATQIESEAGWPLRQIEIGLGALVFALGALTVLAIRQRRRGVGAR